MPTESGKRRLNPDLFVPSESPEPAQTSFLDQGDIKSEGSVGPWENRGEIRGSPAAQPAIYADSFAELAATPEQTVIKRGRGRPKRQTAPNKAQGTTTSQYSNKAEKDAEHERREDLCRARYKAFLSDTEEHRQRYQYLMQRNVIYNDQRRILSNRLEIARDKVETLEEDVNILDKGQLKFEAQMERLGVDMDRAMAEEALKGKFEAYLDMTSDEVPEY